MGGQHLFGILCLVDESHLNPFEKDGGDRVSLALARHYQALLVS